MDALKTISDSLRDAIQSSGMSVTAIAKEVGVAQPMLTRFVNGKDVRLETANKLAAYFRLQLQPIDEHAPAASKRPSPKKASGGKTRAAKKR